MKFRHGGPRLRMLVTAGAIACLAPPLSRPVDAQATKPDASPSPGPKPKPKPGGTADAVPLQLRFPEGETLRYRTSGEVYQFVSMGGRGYQSRERKTVDRSLAVGRKRDDATLPIAVKVDSLHVDLKIQGKIELTFDSKSPDAATLPGPEYASVLEPYRWESGSAYTVVLGGGPARFTVKAVEGTDGALRRALELDPISRAQIQGVIDPARLQARFEQELRVWPDEPVRPGGSWERTELFDGGDQPLSVRKRYTYVGPEKHEGRTLAKITSKALEVKCLPPGPQAASPLTITKNELKVDSSEGTFLFDRESGRLVESRKRAKFSGRVTFSADGVATSATVDFSWRTTTRLEPAR